MKNKTFDTIMKMETFEEKLKALIKADLSKYLTEFLVDGTDHFDTTTDRGTKIKLHITSRNNYKFQIYLYTNDFDIDITGDNIANDKNFMMAIFEKIKNSKSFGVDIKLKNYTMLMRFENANLNVTRFERLIKGE